MVIRQYELSIQKHQQLALPKKCNILSVTLEDGPGVPKPLPKIFLNVAEDANSEIETRTFLILSGGQTGPDSGIVYIGTITTNDGAFVVHIFENIEEPTLTPEIPF